MKHTYISKLALVVWSLFNFTASNAQYFNGDYGQSIQNLSGGNEGLSNLVNEYTGQVNYTIPIAELKLNGNSFPISVSYASSGVKVDDYASCVGLGWSLNAGGTITKITKGVDDDLIGPNGEHIGYNTTPTMAFNFYTVYSGQRDGGKDYYVYNIFGITGKFAKFNSTDYATIEGDNFKIEFESSFGAFGRFTIHDNSGNKFHFTLRETISTFKDNSNSASHTTEGSWFLTNVELADGKQILLSYESQVINRLKSAINEFAVTVYEDGCPGAGECKTNHEVSVYFNTFNSYRIKSIEALTQKVEFVYSSIPRQDITDSYSLNEIKLFRNDHLEKQYNLSFNYTFGRLMLSSVLELTDDFNLTNTIASFDYYHEEVMPPPFSLLSQDLMGYFNGAAEYRLYINYNGSICEHKQPVVSLAPPNGYGQSVNISGANRGFGDINKVQTLMLKKIINKYGAVHEIKYEPNEYMRSYYGGDILERTYGVRVFKITNYNLTEPNKKIYYTYVYKNPTTNVCSGVGSKLYTDETIKYKTASGCDGYLRLAGTNYRKIVGNNSLVTYEYVQKFVHNQENNHTGTFISATVNKYSVKQNAYINIYNNYPMLLGTYETYKNGNLLGTTQYSSAWIVIDKFDYEYGYINGASFPSIEIKLKSVNGANLFYDSTQYVIFTGRKSLNKIVHSVYNTSGTLMLNETTLFEYDQFNQVTKTLRKVNNINQSAQYYSYPYHYNVITANDSYADAVRFMNQNNIRKPLLETINTRFVGSNEYVVASTLKLYHIDLGTNIVYVKKELEYRSFNPELYSTTSTPSFNKLAFNNGVTSFSNRFFEVKNVEKLDNLGNISSVVLNSTEPHTSFSMSDGHIYADFDNLSYRESTYLGFEYYETEPNAPQYNENWIPANGTCFNSALVLNSGYTGSYALNFSLCNGLTLANAKTMNNTKTYTLKYWKKQGTINVQASGGNVGGPLIIYTNGPWSLVQHKITNSSAITISSNDAIIDDLILIPVGGSLNYSVYDKLQQVVAKGDDTGIIEFYEYDALGRLIIMRDANSNIIKKIEYGIKEQQ